MKVLPEGFVTIKEVSEQANACIQSIRADINEGKLHVYRIPHKKPDLFKEEEVRRYVREHRTPQPK